MVLRENLIDVVIRCNQIVLYCSMLFFAIIYAVSPFSFVPFRFKYIFFSFSLGSFVSHLTGSCGVVSAFTKGKSRQKAKHWRLFKLDDREAPSDDISVDEGHRCGADSLTAAHLSLREKMPLVDLDLVLV